MKSRKKRRSRRIVFCLFVFRRRRRRREWEIETRKKKRIRLDMFELGGPTQCLHGRAEVHTIPPRWPSQPGPAAPPHPGPERPVWTPLSARSHNPHQEEEEEVGRGVGGVAGHQAEFGRGEKWEPLPNESTVITMAPRDKPHHRSCTHTLSASTHTHAHCGPDAVSLALVRV